MDFGLHLGTRGAASSPDNLVALAQHAERLGLAYLGFSDHVVIARSIASRYPYNESGGWPAVSTGFCLEQITCLTYEPVQKPHPPIWIGGEGAAARRRAGRLGDGWYPTIRNPKEPLDTPAAFAAALADVRRNAEAAGRDPMAVDVAMFAPGYSLGAPQKGRDGGRLAFTGSAQAIAEDARAFRAAGVKHIVIGLESNNLQDYLDRVEGFAEEVVPLVG